MLLSVLYIESSRSFAASAIDTRSWHHFSIKETIFYCSYTQMLTHSDCSYTQTLTQSIDTHLLTHMYWPSLTHSINTLLSTHIYQHTKNITRLLVHYQTARIHRCWHTLLTHICWHTCIDHHWHTVLAHTYPHPSVHTHLSTHTKGSLEGAAIWKGSLSGFVFRYMSKKIPDMKIRCFFCKKIQIHVKKI